MPDIVSKHLRATLWNSCALQFESEQTPFSQTGHWLRSAALHRIRFGTWGFVHFFTCCSVHIYHIFNQRPIKGRKIERSKWLCCGWQQLLANHFTWKKSDSLLPDIYKSLNPFDCRTHKSGSTFSPCEPVAASSDCSRLGNTLCLCTRPTRPSCAGALPQVLGYWFCSQIHRFSSRIAFGSTGIGQQGLKLGLKTWTLPPDQWIVEVFSAPKPPAPKQFNKLCWVWIVLERQKWGQQWVIIIPHLPDCCVLRLKFKNSFWREGAAYTGLLQAKFTHKFCHF